MIITSALENTFKANIQNISNQPISKEIEDKRHDSEATIVILAKDVILRDKTNPNSPQLISVSSNEKMA